MDEASVDDNTSASGSVDQGGPPAPQVRSAAVSHLNVHPFFSRDAVPRAHTNAAAGRSARAPAAADASSSSARFGPLAELAESLRVVPTLDPTSMPATATANLASAADSFDDDDDDDDDDDEAVDDNWGDNLPDKRKRKVAEDEGADALEDVAFGAPPGRRWRRNACHQIDASSVSSVSESTRQRAAQRRMFPVEGLSCVLCQLAHRIAPLQQFLERNVTELDEEALFKLSVVVWNDSIVKPLQAEHVPMPSLNADAIRRHFVVCTSGFLRDKLTRNERLRSLRMFRLVAEKQLVSTRMGDDGEMVSSIDTQRAKLYFESLDREAKLSDEDRRARAAATSATGVSATGPRK